MGLGEEGVRSRRVGMRIDTVAGAEVKPTPAHTRTGNPQSRGSGEATSAQSLATVSFWFHHFFLISIPLLAARVFFMNNYEETAVNFGKLK